jgi:hypothetical protein
MNLIIIAVIVVVVLMLLRGSEEQYASRMPFRPASPKEIQQLGVYAWSCQSKWQGQVGFTPYGGKDVAVCKLPSNITNVGMLNYQLAGRLCELEGVHFNSACKTPGVVDNPYAYDVSRGYFRLF